MNVCQTASWPNSWTGGAAASRRFLDSTLPCHSPASCPPHQPPIPHQALHPPIDTYTNPGARICSKQTAVKYAVMAASSSLRCSADRCYCHAQRQRPQQPHWRAQRAGRTCRQRLLLRAPLLLLLLLPGFVPPPLPQGQERQQVESNQSCISNQVGQHHQAQRRQRGRRLDLLGGTQARNAAQFGVLDGG